MKQLLLCCVAILLSLGVFSQEIVVDATPPTYLKFQNPPFVVNGTTFVPLREIANAMDISIEKALSLVGKNTIVLSDQIHGGSITFAPARLIAIGLKLDIVKTDTLLTIGTTTWEIDGKLIVIDLSKQRIYAFEGLTLIYDLKTCTGKPSSPTPTGIYSVYKKSPGWVRWKKSKWIAWDGAIYNTLSFDPPHPPEHKHSRGMHGIKASAVKPYPDSHGCPRMFCRDADQLYPWAPIGTPVYVTP